VTLHLDQNQIMLPEVKSCGVLLFRSEPEESFLLMKHPHRWDLPKGHVDPGESETECALRELQEETGITPDLISLDPRFRYATQYVSHEKRLGGTEVLKTLVVFLGRLVGPVEIQTTEHNGFAWFRWNPPHQIQEQAIDPLLAYVAGFLEDTRKMPHS
jgi:8-oxo-dGTP pyrophosphatase MutT (NUDIX family)